MPVWIVVLIASREIWATLLRAYARRSGVVHRRRAARQGKMVFQVVVVLTLITFDLSGAALAVPLYAMVAITIGVRHRDRAAGAARARAGPGARNARVARAS